MTPKNLHYAKTHEWDATDWHDHYNERAAIYEYDGKLSRQDAEQRAFDACINHWMNKNPPAHTDKDSCPECKRRINVHENNALVTTRWLV